MDFINVYVGYAIAPAQSDVTLGDVMCLSSALVNENGYAGKWHSGSHVVQLDSQTGVSLATQVGSSVVSYNLTNAMATHTKITVQPISSVTLSNQAGHDYVTNVEQKYKDLIFPVTFTDRRKQVIQSSIHGNNCSAVLSEHAYHLQQLAVRCEASLTDTNPHIVIEELVTVTTEFHIPTGKYQCKLSQVTSPNLTPRASILDSSISLRAVVPQREGQNALTSDAVTLPFYPAFHVQTSEVSLSNEMFVTKLRISTTKAVLQRLKVTAMDASLIAVDEPESDQFGGIASYPIRLQLTNNLWERSNLDTVIEISCQLTGYSQTVPVRVTLVGSKESQQKLALTWRDVVMSVRHTDFYQLLFLILAVIATLACLVIAYQVMMGARYTSASQQSGAFMTPAKTPPPAHLQHPFAALSPLNGSGGASPPRLWSVDYGPYDNSGIFKRSPLQQSPRS